MLGGNEAIIFNFPFEAFHMFEDGYLSDLLPFSYLLHKELRRSDVHVPEIALFLLIGIYCVSTWMSRAYRKLAECSISFFHSSRGFIVVQTVCCLLGWMLGLPIRSVPEYKRQHLPLSEQDGDHDLGLW